MVFYIGPDQKWGGRSAAKSEPESEKRYVVWLRTGRRWGGNFLGSISTRG